MLGTVNPAAARVYHRLGWRKLAGAAVMVNVLNGESPKSFLVGYFKEGTATVAEATPAHRIAIVPLLVGPHDWQVLDANAKMYSTRYATLRSCMGLYVRYQRIKLSAGGAWFVAKTAEGRVVGLATARRDDAGDSQIDGFAHARFAAVWEALVQAAINAFPGQSASTCYAVVSVEDGEKQSLFESLGFRTTGPGEEFDLDGRRVASIRMDRMTA